MTLSYMDPHLPQPFLLDTILNDDYYLAFDVFLKNDGIHLICPIYANEFQVSDIRVTDHNQSTFHYPLHKNAVYKHTKYYCSCQVLIYRVNPAVRQLTVDIQYKHLTRTFKLSRVAVPSCTLSLTTLFNHAEYLFPMIFYKYYKAHGVDHFYLYYNGEIPDHIRNSPAFARDDVTLIPWNYRYWNDQSKSVFLHHAQIGQMNHALYKYGKGSSDYMVFNDFDEYFLCPERLCDLIRKTQYNAYGFRNRHARLTNPDFPKKLPFYIDISDKPLGYTCQSKTIWKCDFPDILQVHTCATIRDTYNQRDATTMYLDETQRGFQPDYLNDMYHFDWNKPDRICDRPLRKVMSYFNVRLANVVYVPNTTLLNKLWKHIHEILDQTLLPDEIVCVCAGFEHHTYAHKQLEDIRATVENQHISIKYVLDNRVAATSSPRSAIQYFSKGYRETSCDFIVCSLVNAQMHRQRNEALRHWQSQYPQTKGIVHTNLNDVNPSSFSLNWEEYTPSNDLFLGEPSVELALEKGAWAYLKTNSDSLPFPQINAADETETDADIEANEESEESKMSPEMSISQMLYYSGDGLYSVPN